MDYIFSEKQFIESLLNQADVKINGKRPWDIQVYNTGFYKRVFEEGSLGLGESYMDGWWDAPALEQFFYKVFCAGLNKKLKLNWHTIKLGMKWSLLNMQTRLRAKKVAQEHYDLGNNFYMLFLGPYNQYTSLYYKGAKNMEDAEKLRLDLMCKKLQLKKGDRVLDIGCGWGGFSKYAAKYYGCRVTGISISSEQIKYAREFTKGLPVTILKKDYRDLKGTFDKIVIAGMIEHVGYKNYRAIMKIVQDCLVDGGLFLLDTLGDNESRKESEPWMDKYIFPNSQAPSLAQLFNATERLLIAEDFHNFGYDYATTCIDWFKKFNKNWSKIKKIDNKFNTRFYRMWKYYLLCSAGSLRARNIQQWQFVFSKKGVLGGYTPVR